MAADLDSESLVVVRIGLFQIQVCTPKSWGKARIRDETNRADTCGTTTGWTFKEPDDQPEPDCGDPVPNGCAEDPNRRHWILWA